MTLLLAFSPAHATRHCPPCARLTGSARSIEKARQPEARAPEKTEVEDSAGRAEWPGFGPLPSPSRQGLRTAPQQHSPAPDSCRLGNSLRHMPEHPRPRPDRPQRLVSHGDRMPRKLGPLDSAHGECQESSAGPFRQPISPPRLRRGATSRPDWLGDFSRVGPKRDCRRSGPIQCLLSATC
jgi:hypothetical protein